MYRESINSLPISNCRSSIEFAQPRQLNRWAALVSDKDSAANNSLTLAPHRSETERSRKAVLPIDQNQLALAGSRYNPRPLPLGGILQDRIRTELRSELSSASDTNAGCARRPNHRASAVANR